MTISKEIKKPVAKPSETIVARITKAGKLVYTVYPAAISSLKAER
jgi:hypothetical protein